MREELNKFQKGIELFRNKVFKELPLQQLYIFLLTAVNEGLNQQDFMKLLDVPAGTVSRNLSKLSIKIVEDENGAKDVGYGLIELRPDLYDTKKNIVFLTKRGKRLAEELKQVLNGVMGE